MAGGLLTTFKVPYWVIICCHLALGGTLAGGWRIIKAMGKAVFGIPVSATHTITGAIVGAGASRRLTAVRRGVRRRIVWAWVLTIPGAALMRSAVYRLLTAMIG